ncbi:hypothetical protein LIA77_00808 [Sarocladium implicatum]|nr:hypothetical protein LIA77_00808 [Sarocladium implicatum]
MHRIWPDLGRHGFGISRVARPPCFALLTIATPEMANVVPGEASSRPRCRKAEEVGETSQERVGTLIPRPSNDDDTIVQRAPKLIIQVSIWHASSRCLNVMST